jgi:hypothetical protein
MGLWEQEGIERNAVVYRRVGPLALWLRRNDVEWHVAAERLPSEASEPGDAADLEWRRWSAGNETDRFRLQPVMPDRSVVARPEATVSLLPGHSALFYVSIPVWVAVNVGEGEGLRLCEEPAVALSSTWFGEPTSGELCYSLRTRARRTLADGDERVHRAVCPLHVTNGAEEQLEMAHICIRSEHLTLYEGLDQLWTNQVRVQFRGDKEESRVDYDDRPPEECGAASALTLPRVMPQSGLLRKSVATLDFLTGVWHP